MEQEKPDFVAIIRSNPKAFLVMFYLPSDVRLSLFRRLSKVNYLKITPKKLPPLEKSLLPFFTLNSGHKRSNFN